MGKSTCAQRLAEWQIPVIDTDEVAHELTRPGEPALGEISSIFGSHLIDLSGRLDRVELGRIVFNDASARKQLELILHPKIQERWSAEVERWRAQQQRVGVVIIPLLFETRAESSFDATVCVACSKATQAERLRARGWTADDAGRRISAQMPVEQKMEKSDFVIWSEGTLEVLGSQLQRIILP